MKIAFVCDSGTGLAPHELEELGIYGVPLQIGEGESTKLEGIDIQVDEVYEKMGQDVSFTTSLISTSYCETLFARLKKEGYEMIFAIPICSGLSGSINAMRLCADRVDLIFDYYDCHVTFMVELYMCQRAKELYEQGKSIGEIKIVLKDIVDSANTILVPNDLQHLKRGGRLSPAAATLGGLLRIKPILQIGKKTKGRIDVLEKVRTSSKAYTKVVDVMKKEIKGTGVDYSITISHVCNEEAAQTLIEKCEIAFPDAQITRKTLVSVVGIHTGLGCVSSQYFKKQ